MPNNTDVMQAVSTYLASAGAEVTGTFEDPGPGNLFARYTMGEHEYLIGVTSDAEHALRHWTAAEIDEFLHSYRVVPGCERLSDDEFLLIQTTGVAPPPDTTYLNRGIVVAGRLKVDFGVR